MRALLPSASVAFLLLLAAMAANAQVADLSTIVPKEHAADELPWPEWMFGHWVWEDESTQESAIALVDDYLAHDMRVSAIIIDSPWETGYNTFEWDTALFHDPQGMIDYFHSRDVRVFMWITGVINTDVQPLYDEAVANNYFMRQYPWSSGPGIINWWKGVGSLIDWWNPEAVTWWKGLMDLTLDMGIDGWKVDGSDYNALIDQVFYSPGNGGIVSRNAYSEAYYRIFHEYTRERLGNDRVNTARPIDNYGIGDIGGSVALFAPRDINYCGWVGDQDATFEGLVAAMNNMYHSAEAKFLAFGSDIGGYRENSDFPLSRSKELFIRWAQFGTFSSIMENGGGGEHRPWVFDEETEQIYHQLVQFRYQIVPYLMAHSEAYYEQERSLMEFFNKTDYSFMLGPDIFVTPFMQEGTSITVNFPVGDNWVYLYDESQVYPGGTQATFTFPYTEFPVYIREGSSPMAVEEPAPATFTIHPNPSDGVFTVTAKGGNSISAITVMDALGREVVTQGGIVSRSTALDLGHLPAGMYVVRAVAMDGGISVERVVVR
jgi:alpha-glucosidase (family GH31 glycosyl hydrolase)